MDSYAWEMMREAAEAAERAGCPIEFHGGNL